MKKITKKSQVWIETVIYTLIGLSILGIVLGIVKPELQKRQDSIALKQGVDVLNSIDEKINEVKGTGAGNVRQLSIRIGQGKLVINSIDERVSILLEKSRYEYSEPGQEVSVGGNIKAFTVKRGGLYDVNLTLDYKTILNITHNGKEESQTFQKAAANYDVWIKNNGLTNGLPNIDFS